MSFFSALTLIFIALKLMGEITWSWFWVLSPLYPIIVIFILAFVSFLFRR